MSYQSFNQKQSTPNNGTNFTPWSHSLGNLLTPNHSNTYHQSNININPLLHFPQLYPLLIHQQNNFYNSNITVNPQPNNPLPIPPIMSSSFRKVLAQFNPKPYRTQKRTIAPGEVIVISDDDEAPPPKPMVAVVKEKSDQPIFRPADELKPSKQSLFVKRVESKESKSSKKMAKVEETVKEDEPFAKKKKIYKERSGYKYNSYLKELEISGYRDYRPDLIMVGPQFQATIDDQALYRDKEQWMRTVREQLQMRRQQKD